MAEEVATPTIETPQSSWRDSLPEDLKADKSLESFKDIGALAKSFVETKKLVGAKSGPPKDDAPAEEWNRWHTANGRPETPDKYEITRPEGVPEHIVPDEVMMGKAKALFHSLGLNQKQVSALVAFDAERALRVEDLVKTADATARKDAESELAKEWGPKDGPAFKRNLALARSAVGAIFGDKPQYAAWAEDRGNDPVFVRLLSHIGERLLEDGAITGETPGLTSPADAQAQIDQLKQSAAYRSAAHPDHMTVLEQITALRRLALGRNNEVLTVIP